jgi:lipid-binding SYLF domain-containing protein
MYALEGGSLGLEIGGEATDLIPLVMNDRGMDADASVAGGPKGRDASADTDAWMRAEILSYSRSRGLFAGLSPRGLYASFPTTRQANRSMATPSRQKRS